MYSLRFFKSSSVFCISLWIFGFAQKNGIWDINRNNFEFLGEFAFLTLPMHVLAQFSCNFNYIYNYNYS